MNAATKLPGELGPIHFVGIGGIGMSGIAEVMKNLIGVNHSDSSPTHADVQFKALETYRDYLPFTPGSRYRSEWWIFTD